MKYKIEKLYIEYPDPDQIDNKSYSPKAKGLCLMVQKGIFINSDGNIDLNLVCISGDYDEEGWEDGVLIKFSDYFENEITEEGISMMCLRHNFDRNEIVNLMEEVK